MKKLLSILLSVVLAISLFTPVSADGYDNTIVLPSGDVITVTEYENGRIVVDYYSQNNHIEYDSFLDEVFDVDTHETLATTYEIVAGVNMLDPGMSNGTNQYVVVDPTQGGLPGYYWYRDRKIKSSWIKETQSTYTNISISNKTETQIVQTTTVVVVGILTGLGYTTSAISLFIDLISPWTSDIIFTLNASMSGNQVVYSGSAYVHTVYFHWASDSSTKIALTEGIASDWTFVGFLKIPPNLQY